jgi:hypothetical protein
MFQKWDCAEGRARCNGSLRVLSQCKEVIAQFLYGLARHQAISEFCGPSIEGAGKRPATRKIVRAVARKTAVYLAPFRPGQNPSQGIETILPRLQHGHRRASRLLRRDAEPPDHAAERTAAEGLPEDSVDSARLQLP